MQDDETVGLSKKIFPDLRTDTAVKLWHKVKETAQATRVVCGGRSRFFILPETLKIQSIENAVSRETENWGLRSFQCPVILYFFNLYCMRLREIPSNSAA